MFLTDLAGNKSALSKSLTVTFAPDAPSAPVLAPASASGTAGSNVTNFTTNLVFTVATAGAKNTVELFRAPASAPASTTLVGTIVGPRFDHRSRSAPARHLHLHGAADRPVQHRQPAERASGRDDRHHGDGPDPGPARPELGFGDPGGQLTNVTGSLVFDVFGVSAGTTILLFQNNSQVNSLTTADAMGTATITGGAVAGITVNSGGAGYVFTPQVTISGGGGSGAAATAVLTNGVVTAVHHHHRRQWLYRGTDGHDRPPDRDGDGDGDDQQWHGRWRR